METKNIELTVQGWQDLITLGNLTLTDGDTYTIAPCGGGIYEVALANNIPEDNFHGHPVQSGTNFNFVYNNENIWIRGYYPAIIVIS